MEIGEEDGSSFLHRADFFASWMLARISALFLSRFPREPRAARFETLVCRSRKDNVSVSQAPQPAFEWTEKWEPPSRDNVLPLSRAISYSHEQATDQWMEWLESSFATCAFFNAPNRRPWFLSAGRLSFFCRSLFPRSRDHDERGLASFFLSLFNRDADIIRFASTTWCGRIVKIFVGKVTRDLFKSPFEFHARNVRVAIVMDRFRVILQIIYDYIRI